jgi:hypothetical protein
LNLPSPPTNLRITFGSSIASQANTAKVTSNVAPPPNVLVNVTDNQLGTYSTLASPEILLIDLGQPCAVDRVLLMGTSNQVSRWPNYSQNANTAPLGLLVVYVGNAGNTSNQVAQYTVPCDAGNPIEADADLRFSPAVGRYVRIEFHNQVAWGNNYWPGYAIGSQPAPTNVTMNVREIELYGFSGAAATQTNLNAVVLPTNAPAPLALAAQDLSYYLSELTGSPHPIILPQSTNQFSGTIYRIVDLASLAPNYATMMANIASGALNTNVQVAVSGREIIFSSWPYRCVLWSVWEFLERQGIRWVYPDSHGDFIPTGAGVNLSVAPFQYVPPTESIYANFDLNVLEPWPVYQLESPRQEFLYFWRNRWTFQSGYGPLGGPEIPAMPSPNVVVNSNFTEGFVGYPHNFSSVVPQRIVDQNSNWWGYSTTTGTRMPPESNGAPAFCMDNPSLISWVAAKMTNIAAAQPLACAWPLNICHWHRPFNLLPLDATVYCADPQWCTPSNGPPQANPEPWVKLYGNACSGEYYSFVTAVANAVQQMHSGALVGALAYADVFVPPATIASFPTNVQVEVCLYGAPNLPMTAAANAGLKSALDGWHARCGNLATYDYALLHTDYPQPDPRLPAPLVAGTLGRSQYLASLGAADGGSQGNLDSLPYNPWNFYAYPRTRWNTNQTAAQIEQEFFNGYFREAAAPALAYYQTLENYQVTNGVNLHYAGYCYGMTPGAFPISILAQMQGYLTQAQAAATNWYVVQRVANLAAGFNWLVANSSDNLVGVNLNDTSPYPVLNPQPFPVAVNLTNMTAPPNSVTGNNAYLQGPAQGFASYDWWFGGVGLIQQTYNMAAGTYKVDVVASGVASGGTWPVMNIYLGPAWNCATVTSSTNATYSFTNTIPGGVFDLVASYNGTGNPPPQLTISSISITKL